jgi:hypothetical protein
LVSLLAVNVHVITTSLAGILNVHVLFQTKSYHGAVAPVATITVCSYLYPLVAGNSLAQVGLFAYLYITL